MFAPNPDTPRPGEKRIPTLRIDAPKPRCTWRSVIGYDDAGVIRCSEANVADAARAVGRARNGIWEAIKRGRTCAGLMWRFADEPIAVTRPPAYEAPTPATFAEAVALADAMPWRNGMRRPRFVWEGVTHLRCSGCRDWMPEGSFGAIPAKSSGTNNVREPKCRACERRVRREAWRRKRDAAGKFSREAMRAMAATAEPQPVREAVAPPAPTPRPAVTKVATTEGGGHPGRMGYDAAAWAEAEHRGRYERLRQIDPTLTWEDWTQLTDRRPPGRQPKPGGHAEQQAARAKRRAERKAARGGWAWEGAGEESE